MGYGLEGDSRLRKTSFGGNGYYPGSGMDDTREGWDQASSRSPSQDLVSMSGGRGLPRLRHVLSKPMLQLWLKQPSLFASHRARRRPGNPVSFGRAKRPGCDAKTERYLSDGRCSGDVELFFRRRGSRRCVENRDGLTGQCGGLAGSPSPLRQVQRFRGSGKGFGNGGTRRQGALTRERPDADHQQNGEKATAADRHRRGPLRF